MRILINQGSLGSFFSNVSTFSANENMLNGLQTVISRTNSLTGGVKGGLAQALQTITSTRNVGNNRLLAVRKVRSLTTGFISTANKSDNVVARMLNRKHVMFRVVTRRFVERRLSFWEQISDWFRSRLGSRHDLHRERIWSWLTDRPDGSSDIIDVDWGDYAPWDNPPSNNVSGNNIPFFSQWPYSNNQPYWNGIWSKYGCAVAAVAMALSSFGDVLTPYQIFRQNGSSLYMNWWKLGTVHNNPGSLDDALNRFFANPSRYAPPIIEEPGVYGGLHFVVVIGRNNDGTFRVLDPARGEINLRGPVQRIIQYVR